MWKVSSRAAAARCDCVFGSEKPPADSSCATPPPMPPARPRNTNARTSTRRRRATRTGARRLSTSGPSWKITAVSYRCYVRGSTARGGRMQQCSPSPLAPSLPRRAGSAIGTRRPPAATGRFGGRRRPLRPRGAARHARAAGRRRRHGRRSPRQHRVLPGLRRGRPRQDRALPAADAAAVLAADPGRRTAARPVPARPPQRHRHHDRRPRPGRLDAGRVDRLAGALPAGPAHPDRATRVRRRAGGCGGAGPATGSRPGRVQRAPQHRVARQRRCRRWRGRRAGDRRVAAAGSCGWPLSSTWSPPSPRCGLPAHVDDAPPKETTDAPPFVDAGRQRDHPAGTGRHDGAAQHRRPADPGTGHPAEGAPDPRLADRADPRRRRRRRPGRAPRWPAGCRPSAPPGSRRSLCSRPMAACLLAAITGTLLFRTLAVGAVGLGASLGKYALDAALQTRRAGLPARRGVRAIRDRAAAVVGDRRRHRARAVDARPVTAWARTASIGVLFAWRRRSRSLGLYASWRWKQTSVLVREKPSRS